jgi:hypothetical protein
VVDDEREREAQGRLPWAVPEVAGASILIAFGLLVLGGLVSGIDLAATNQPALGNSLIPIWTSVASGASWAEPLLAIALLGATGLCWWQADRWADDANDSEDALAYIRRARSLGNWMLGALGFTALGSIASLVAAVGLDLPSNTGQVGWSRVTEACAVTIAVIAIAVGGLMIVRDIGQAVSTTE